MASVRTGAAGQAGEPGRWPTAAAHAPLLELPGIHAENGSQSAEFVHGKTALPTVLAALDPAHGGAA
jgi:hypothetical protein